MLAESDPQLDAWIDAATGPLRQAINVLELALDPETVVVGGFMPVSILEILVSRLEPLQLSVSTTAERSVPRVLIGAAGKDTLGAGRGGAADFFRDQPAIRRAAEAGDAPVCHR